MMTIEEIKAEVLSAGWAWLSRSLDEGETLRARDARYYVNISRFDRENGVITGGAERSCKAIGATEEDAFQLAFDMWLRHNA